MKVHGEVRRHIDPETSGIPDHQRKQLVTHLKALADEGHEGEHFTKNVKDKESGNTGKTGDVIKKAGLRHFALSDGPKSGKYGHLGVTYHYSPKSNTYYVHRIHGHNIEDRGEVTRYQNAAQNDILKSRAHMLEALSSFQQRYLKKLIK